MQQIQEFTQSTTSTSRINGAYEVGRIQSLKISQNVGVVQTLLKPCIFNTLAILLIYHLSHSICA